MTMPAGNGTNGELKKIIWAALTGTLALLVALIGAWASQMQAADAQARADIKRLEERQAVLEQRYAQIDTKLDLLIGRSRGGEPWRR
jgi:hypothetical protein